MHDNAPTDIGTITAVTCSAPGPEEDAEEMAETEHMALDISRVTAQLTVFAAGVKRMKCATFLQKNVINAVKNELTDLEELLYRIFFYRQN